MSWVDDMDRAMVQHPEEFGMTLDEQGNPVENPHPTVKDKDQDAERKAKGTEGAKVDPEKGGEEHDGPTFTDQGKPV